MLPNYYCSRTITVYPFICASAQRAAAPHRGPPAPPSFLKQEVVSLYCKSGVGENGVKWERKKKDARVLIALRGRAGLSGVEAAFDAANPEGEEEDEEDEEDEEEERENFTTKTFVEFMEPMDRAGLDMTNKDIAGGEGRGSFDEQITREGSYESWLCHSHTEDHPDVKKVRNPKSKLSTLNPETLYPSLYNLYPKPYTWTLNLKH